VHVPDEGDVERMIRHGQVMIRQISRAKYQIHSDYQRANVLTLVFGAYLDFVH
jgi:hypothetical protein